MRPGGVLATAAAGAVVVGEVVHSNPADRMGLECVERDPPEVVAPAADIGEVRAGRSHDLMGEAVPLLRGVATGDGRG